MANFLTQFSNAHNDRAFFPHDLFRATAIKRDIVFVAKNFPCRFLDQGRRIGYVGWVGQRNLGDQIMFEVARSLVGPELELSGTSRAEWILNTIASGSSSRFRSVFLGGGTLIGPRFIDDIQDYLNRGAELATLGTGVGASGFLETDASVNRRWVDTLERFERVGLRGPLSLEKLQRAGFSRGEVIGDLALALTPDRPIANWDCRCVMINAANGRNVEDRARLALVYRSLAKLVRSLSEKDWQIIPVAFDPTDRVALQGILDAAELYNTSVEEPQDFNQYATLAKRTRISIGVRLHSSVLASACGVPNILFNYRDKCLDFAASVGRERALLSLENFDENMLTNAFEQIQVDPAAAGHELHKTCLGYRELIRNYVRSIL